MMDELTAKFLPRFATLARDRLKQAREAATGRLYDKGRLIVHDLHAMAGEAGLLGLGAVVTAARSAEDAARRFGQTSSESDALKLLECLEPLERAVADATGSHGA
jgi:HPt (histidine-containing phosphotransfer) domain-containing protein